MIEPSTAASASDAIRVRSIAAADIESVSAMLARSFAAEPFHRWMVPDDADWSGKAPRFFRSYLNLVRGDGRVDVADQGQGAAVWLTPDRPGGGLLSRFAVPWILWRLCGRQFPQVWSVIPEIERHRPTAPHWYLDVLGVDPSAQGRGLGRALLEAGLARCDVSGKEVFVDTLVEQTARFYEAHGFKTVASFSLSNGLPIWCLVRPARGK